MPELPHFILPRAEYNLPRKKHGFGRAPKRDSTYHGAKLEGEIDKLIEHIHDAQFPEEINPELILRIEVSEDGAIDENLWANNSLTLLSVDKNKSLVLFATDHELKSFKRRLNEYKNGPPKGQKSAPHSALFSSIDHISEIYPDDRIGPRFKQEGIISTANISPIQEYLVDIELWDLQSIELVDHKINEIKTFIERNNGEATDTYKGGGLVIIRARCLGKTLSALLTFDSVSIADLPPKSDVLIDEYLDSSLEDFSETPPPDDDAPKIAVFDTGITSPHPFIAPAVVEATSIPGDLGDGADDNGHGTRVAGVALYGDIEESAAKKAFTPMLSILSAKVVDKYGEFSDKQLVVSQMDEAVRYFHNTYGCRVFNISLADNKLVFDGGKVSGWSAILDSLMRELDVVIVVATGNYSYVPHPGDPLESVVTGYPNYLLSDDCRLHEPATGAIVVTVGSVSNSDLLPANAGYGHEVRPIAAKNQPSPFTRRGPGCGGAIKPEFCSYGGNVAFDGALQRRRRDIDTLSVLSFNHEYLNNLFKTSVGTSYASPRVAHIAALLTKDYPDASANLIRAFLAASSDVPSEARELLEPFGDDSVLNLCGYGIPDIEKAMWSDNNRVVLYAESSLEHDNFHIYEVPIPELFVSTKGDRSISVSLAYDPPVRHSRIDYLGTKMSFRLIRGKSVNEVADAFRKMAKDDDPVDALGSTKYDCKMEPKARVREAGTLQKATFTMKCNPADYGDTYFLVVRCENKWAPLVESPQRYALVVQLEHTTEVDLHAQVQARIQPPVRIRI